MKIEDFLCSERTGRLHLWSERQVSSEAQGMGANCYRVLARRDFGTLSGSPDRGGITIVSAQVKKPDRDWENARGQDEVYALSAALASFVDKGLISLGVQVTE